MDAKKLFSLFLGFCLALGGCSFRGSGAASSASAVPQLSVTARPVEAPPPGSYYNSQTDVGLVLDDEGVWAMFAGENSLKGNYYLRGDDVVFASGTEEALAHLDETGLVFEDMPGVFLPIGVAESFASLGVMLSADREYTALEDGSWQVCNYALSLAFVYPGDMSAPEGLLSDAAVVWDGKQAYVVGRNVSEQLQNQPEDFMREYMEQTVIDDFQKLFGSSGRYESMELLQENIPGRLSSAEGVIVTEQERIYVKVIMYTSTYADGTVNQICKGFFAPEDDTAAFNAMANGVTDMTAIRRK